MAQGIEVNSLCRKCQGKQPKEERQRRVMMPDWPSWTQLSPPGRVCYLYMSDGSDWVGEITPRQELREPIKRLPDKKVPSAINLVQSLLFFDEEFELAKMQVDRQRKFAARIKKALAQKGDMIETDLVGPDDFPGQKVPRGIVEHQLSIAIDSSNFYLRNLNFLSLFQTLFHPEFLPLMQNPEISSSGDMKRPGEKD